MTFAQDRAPAPAEASSMRATAQSGGIEVVEHWDEQWRELCDESADDQPFFRPEWIAAHLRAFTPKARVLLVTAASEEKLLFVLPLLREFAIFSGVPVRRLRAPVNPHSHRFDAVRHASREGEESVRAAWSYLDHLGGWDLLQFDDVLEGSTVALLVKAAADAGVHTAKIPTRSNPYVSIPAEAQLGELPVNKRLRTQLRSIRRETAKNGQFQFRRFDRVNPEELKRFYDLEASGWKGAEGSAIACQSRVRQFYDEIAQLATHHGYFRMYSLEMNGELLASHFGLAHKGRYFSPKIAYNERFPQYAPGHLIVSEIVQDCAATGVHEYDITGVNDEWKMKWASQVRPKFTYLVFRKSLPGSLAHALRFRIKPALKKLIKGKPGTPQ